MGKGGAKIDPCCGTPELGSEVSCTGQVFQDGPAGGPLSIAQLAPTRIVTTKMIWLTLSANLIVIDDMMDKLNLLRAKASALGFSIEGEAGR
jgi:hypothetical protein